MNLPNKLTVLRIILVPVVVLVYLCIPETVGIIHVQSGVFAPDRYGFLSQFQRYK